MRLTTPFALVTVTALFASPLGACDSAKEASESAPTTPVASVADGRASAGGAADEAMEGEGKAQAEESSEAEPAAPASAAKPTAARPTGGLMKKGRSAGAVGEVKADRARKVSDRRGPPKPAERKRPRRGADKQSGQLTAGEWRDLDHWDFWRALFESGQGQGEGAWARMETLWGFRTARRQPVMVRTPAGPAVDAVVTLVDAGQKTVWATRTDNAGKADVFADVTAKSRGPLTLIVSSGAKTKTITNVRLDAREPLVVDLVSADAAKNVLDLMFVVDTTGSMGDELNYLQAELKSVLERVRDKNGQQLEMRVSVNFYRDRGDAYLVRPFPFSTDVAASLKQLADQSCGGGGDFPEAVEEAMTDAIDKHKWSKSSRARLLFLVLDAPPHHNDDVVRRMQKLTARAAAAGIHVIPLAGSGINKDTEFLMRFMAVLTGGTYVFLTDDSGIGGSHVKPSIGPHKVEILDRLLVRVINAYLS